MKDKVPQHAEVWVVDTEGVQLFKQSQSGWLEELRMPLEDFAGSATALSSFCLPDTRVYLNVYSKNPAPLNRLSSEKLWAGLAADPQRVVIQSVEQFHQTAFDALKPMGKPLTTISTENPRFFETATHVQLLTAHEIALLQKHHKSTTKMLVALWARPGKAAQHLRLAFFSGIALTGMLIYWQLQPTQHNEQLAALAKLKQNTATESIPAKEIQLGNWADQIRKLGQDKRANIDGLEVWWTNSGEIHTTATLNRDRKKAPKGCVLDTPREASCVATSGKAE